MAALLKLIFDKRVTTEELISWLLVKEIKNESLKNFDKEKADFVPYFLNYLRDQSNALVHSSQTTGLTPVKTFTLYPRKNISSRTGNQKTNHSSSRIELFPGKGEAANKKQQHSDSSSVKHVQLRSEPRSHQKLCFGEFLTPTTACHRKKPHSNLPVKNESLTTIKISPDESIWKSGESSTSQFTSGGNKSNVFNFNDESDFPPVENVNFMSVRKFKMDKSIIHRKENCKASTFNTKSTNERPVPEESIFRHSIDTKETISPSLDKVTVKEKLDVMVEVYSAIFSENLVPNLSTELYFLVQLLTVRIETPGELISIEGRDCNELGTVHNCVYFAVQVFVKQQQLLTFLDKSTLRLLVDNSRVALFASTLPAVLSTFCSRMSNCKAVTTSTSIGTVSFQSDTDNRKNFPGEQAFHIFKKQRDLFYEMLREWEANRMNVGWSFSFCLGDKVRKMVNMWMDPIIYSHLARLFVSQLIAMCKSNCNQINENISLPDLPSELLRNLKKSNPDKLKRLQERFVTPARIGGPSPPPAFAGAQEFFRDFIVFAGSSMFNQHLVDILIFKIFEIDNTQFIVPDKDSTTAVDEDLKQEFASSLLTLRLLGKFLGLITFLPYHTVERLPQGLQEDHVVIRNNVPIAIDVVAVLKHAIANKQVTLTVPWLVEFLSMIDKCAHQLHHIQEGLKAIIQFYKSPWLQLNKDSIPLNRLLVLMLLGWLFETPNFPTSLFFANSNGDDDRGVTEFECQMTEKDSFVDSLELVDHHLLYTCCPYLGELKVLLSEFAAGTGSKTTSIKKIVPILTNDRMPKSSRLLQLQLEENFFHNQPASVKKIVDFVAERLASNIIKHTRKEVVKSVEDRALKALKEFFRVKSDKDHPKDVLKRKVLELAITACNELKAAIDQHTEKYCKSKTNEILQLLMPEETVATTISNCVLITTRQTKEKVTHWVATRVTVAFFEEELHCEVEKFQKKNSSVDGEPEQKMSEPPEVSIGCKVPMKMCNLMNTSPTEVAIRVKSITREMYCSGKVLQPDEIDTLLQDVKTIYSCQIDSTSSIRRCVLQLCVDYIFGLIVLYPAAVTEDRLIILCNIWLSSDLLSNVFPTLICSRNILYLCSSPDSEASWVKLQFTLSIFLKRNVIQPQFLEGQCLQLLKQEWPQEILSKFAKCLDGLIRECKLTTKCDSVEFLELLDWLAWFCSPSKELGD